MSENGFKKPSCWNDKERRTALFAPFRNRCLNPEHYDNKMEFWQNLIAEYVRFQGKPTFSKLELQNVFTHDQQIPSCLDFVIQEMLNTKKIRLLADYEYDPYNTWRGWMVNEFLRKPIFWGIDTIKTSLEQLKNTALSMIGNFTSQNEESGNITYIHLKVMKNLCSKLFSIIQKPPFVGTIMTYGEIKSQLENHITITEESLLLCLHALNMETKIGLKFKQNAILSQIHLVKIPGTGSSNIEISDTDEAIHNLKTMHKDLMQQLEETESEINNNMLKAKQYIDVDKRYMAKLHLRRKQLLVLTYEKRCKAMQNIEILLSNISETQHNSMIVEAYKIGSKALRDCTASLQWDNVDKVMLDVQETIDSFKDLQDQLSAGNLDELSSKDEEDLEKEFEKLKNSIDSEIPTTSIKAEDKCKDIENILNNNVIIGDNDKYSLSDEQILYKMRNLKTNNNTSPSTMKNRKEKIESI